ncbi:MAG: alkane 1-monooxygenase [Chitinophagaceae bacterium]|nr:MAG: alkane 1-monooxygenase [Chitinophagaceae bacterium]
MNVRMLKYLLPLILFVSAMTAFHAQGIAVYIPLILAFFIIPTLEFFLKPDITNLSTAEEELVKVDKSYDLILYAIVPLQFISLFFFLKNISDPSLTSFDMIGRIGVMGLLCGIFGINVGHELGHRVNKAEQNLAKMLLLTSLYMHFFIEHNKGHHKNVATPEDPSSARYGEWVYLFYFRTIGNTYLQAWKIAQQDVLKKHKKPFFYNNEMLQFQLIQLAFLGLILYMFGISVTAYFLLAAFLGILLLETVNYIEHYGLQRTKTQENNYERVQPHHSWNSNHVVGRLFLFELSRHSDHHYIASRKYQLLRHHDHSPQMPTGYPGMILLALLPPVWLTIMNRRIKNFDTTM